MLPAFALLALASALATLAAADTLVYLPLDERYATRGMFLNLARATPFNISTPDASLLCAWKQPADTSALLTWLSTNAVNASVAVISIEMALYGGLINSRVSNDTQDVIVQRLVDLDATLRRVLAPNALVLYTSVVMRIPSYNGDFEEPWYWAQHGRDLYLYSYFSDQGERTQNATAQQLAADAAARVPPAALHEFVWRRQRNLAVSMALLKLGTQGAFAYLCVTLDDNSLFGFNIAEALQLQQTSHALGLDAIVNFHPGADEVGLVMLARAAVLHERRAQRMRVAVLWRLPGETDRVPNFEGQPINTSVYEQLGAAGASAVLAYVPSMACGVDYDVLLVMNNFADRAQGQLEAAQQNFSLPTSQFDALAPAVMAATAQGACPAALADVRYSNGADSPFVQWLFSFPGLTLPGWMVAYAGWNTAGNTLGTAVANGILNALYATGAAGSAAVQAAATQFTMLRVLEDDGYQAQVRQQLIAYVEQSGDSPNDLRPHLDAYEQFVLTRLGVLNQALNAHYRRYDQSLSLDGIYFPWNRTFEVGLQVSTSDAS